MIKPIEFVKQNINFTKPEGLDDCDTLPAYTDGEQCISCWQFSLRERIKILFTGKLWVGVLGRRPLPMWLDARYPFTVLDRPIDVYVPGEQEES